MLLGLAFALLVLIVRLESGVLGVGRASLDVESERQRVKHMLATHVFRFVRVFRQRAVCTILFQLGLVTLWTAGSATVIVVVPHVHEEGFLVVQMLVELKPVVNSLELLLATLQLSTDLSQVWLVVGTFLAALLMRRGFRFEFVRVLIVGVFRTLLVRENTI